MLVMACTGRQDSDSYADGLGLAPRSARPSISVQDRCQLPSRPSSDRYEAMRTYSRNVALPSTLQRLRPALNVRIRTQSEPLSANHANFSVLHHDTPRRSPPYPPSSFNSATVAINNTARPQSRGRHRSDNSIRPATSNSSDEEMVLFLGRQSTTTVSLMNLDFFRGQVITLRSIFSSAI